MVFELSILFTSLLDGVIGQMHEFVAELFELKLFARCAKISFLVPVAFYYPFDGGYQNKAANVKFSLVVEERVLEVFLDDQGATTRTSLVREVADMCQIRHQIDPVASI